MINIAIEMITSINIEKDHLQMKIRIIKNKSNTINYSVKNQNNKMSKFCKKMKKNKKIFLKY